MDYKEEYQNALERAKQGLPLDEVFPELKESEEDEYKVDDICKLIEHATIIPRSGDDDTGIPPTRLNDKYKGELKAFVKSLRPQPKAEWSEEDEKIFNSFCTVLHGGLSSIPTEKFISWLKNRFKALRPQPHWKPSEEQMSALEYFIRSIQREGYIKALKEIESLPKVKGYVARDKDGELAFWGVKPMRWTLDRDTCRWDVPGACYYLNLAYTNMFPEITWESEPVEVELLIRKA